MVHQTKEVRLISFANWIKPGFGWRLLKYRCGRILVGFVDKVFPHSYNPFKCPLTVLDSTSCVVVEGQDGLGVEGLRVKLRWP